MKTVKLKLSEAKARELYPSAPKEFKEMLEESFGADFFNWDPIKSLNDFNDVLKFHKIDCADFSRSLTNLDPDEQAYRQVKLIVSAYNNNERPDYSNRNQVKYYPWFYMPGSASGFSSDGYGNDYSGSGVGSRLVFLKKEHLLDATEKFKDIYNQFFTA